MRRRKDFPKRFTKFFYDLRSKKTHNALSKDQLSEKLRAALKEALKNCVENNNPVTSLPKFQDEAPEIANVLDYVMVRWPFYLYYAIQSREGRAVLRRFADNAQTVLEEALRIFDDNHLFRLSLRVLWTRRAQAFFDGHDKELPYIKHRFSSNSSRPYMIKPNSDKFLSRSAESFSVRNPPAPRSSIDEILNIHSANRLNYRGEIDFFDGYNATGMSSADCYLENQIDQFYRILFFFVELRAAGIKTDEDDIYEGPLPHDILSKHVQSIIYSDCSYRDYLLDERSFYEMLIDNSTQNEILRHFVETARVCEED